MATKKFIIEVEEGFTKCRECPLEGLHCGDILGPIFNSTCNRLNISTMRIKELEEGNNDSRTTD